MKEFEVRVEAELPATPEEVWYALTLNTAAWVWEVSYEPRVGGAERGLAGGTVTAWEPPRHLATRAERPDGWWNNLDTLLEPVAGGTAMHYVHNSVAPEETYDVELDACRKHTALYYHSLAEYLGHFKGRKATYSEADGPEGSAHPGAFDRVRRGLGLDKAASVGDRVRLEPHGLEPIEGVVDYATPSSWGCAPATRCTGSSGAMRSAGRSASGSTCSTSMRTPGGRARRGASGWMTCSARKGARPDGPVRGVDLRARDTRRRGRHPSRGDGRSRGPSRPGRRSRRQGCCRYGARRRRRFATA
jgi:uncharacterized protein YndB with AHSA1/START domain